MHIVKGSDQKIRTARQVWIIKGKVIRGCIDCNAQAPFFNCLVSYPRHCEVQYITIILKWRSFVISRIPLYNVLLIINNILRIVNVF